MTAPIRVFEKNGAWRVADPVGGASSFETREAAIAAAALLATECGRPVEPPVSDGTADT
jgi:hypothetical protein